MSIFGILLFAAAPVFAASAAVDVLVYGATPAAVIAAVQTARMGRAVALVAPEMHLGGIMVNGLGGADINNHWFHNELAAGGLAREVYLRIGRKYGSGQPVYRYESRVAGQVFEELLQEAKVAIHRGLRLREPLKTSVEFKPGTRDIAAITMENGARFHARVFIDATLEGDLLAAAGVETTSGREANSKYGESKNGIRAETTHAQFKVRVDPYRIPGDPKSGLIPTIQDEPLGTPGAGDSNIQAFCFRLCLTRNPANRLPIAKPADFDRSLYEIYFRYARAGGRLWTPQANLPNGKTDLGSWHDLSANLYGMNRDYPDGDYRTRQRIYREHLSFTHGLLWLLANDPEIPESTRAAWRDWGLCRDEFSDNDGWPRMLYIRDARRMVSDYVITEHHTRRINPTPVPDPVAVAYWPTDTHSVRRIVRDGAAYNEGFVFDDNNWGPFGIAFRALVPRRSEAANLITPTCPSSSHVAYGAIRLEQTYMSLGQAAATAAVIALSSGKPVQEVPYSELSSRLLKDGQVLALSLPAPKP
jgi:hypothetical protein